MAQEMILIVEDEAIVAMEIDARLKKLGYRVLGPVSSGEEALEEIERGAPDLVLMDIMLAGKMDGIETAEEIGRKFNIPIIYLTAYADERTLERVKDTDPYGYLLKPFQESDLRISVAVALHKHAIDRKLRESEAKHRLVLDNIHEIVYMMSFTNNDFRGRFRFASGLTEEIIGCRPEELIADPELWTRLIHPDDVPAVIESARGIVENRKAATRLYRLRNRKTGRYLWMEDKVVPRTDEHGAISGYLGVARDITERKQAEEVLRRSYDTQVVISEILRLSLTDSGLAEILQRTIELILSIPWLSLKSRGCIFLADSRRNELIMTAHSNMEPEIVEKCSRLPYGVCFCGRAAATGLTVFSSGGDERHDVAAESSGGHGHYCAPILHGEALLGVINIYVKEGHVRSGTDDDFLSLVANALAGIIKRKQFEEERKRIDQELKDSFAIVARSQKEWQVTFDSITDMISIHNQNFDIVKANRAFARNFNLEPQQVIKRKCHEFFHDLDTPIARCPHRRALEENKPMTEEVTDPTGKVLLVSTFPFTFPQSDERGTIHVVRDITEEREKEMRLIMSERLASLGQMASGIAHEINNPLAAIAGCAEGLLKRIRQERYDPEFFANYLAIIQEEIARCKGITTSMLSIVRKASYVSKPTDIHAVLDKSLEIIGYQGRLKQMRILKDYRAELPVIQGSEGELKQVFLALMTNALDAMEDKGTLTIKTDSIQNRLTISIGDTGCAIVPENIQKVFDPFFTTKSDKGGTGLGLPIALRIIKTHAGSIDVVSEIGRGSTFSIILPLSSQE